jgi:regulator of ribosome biosynthesis
LFKELFDLKRQQKAKEGEDGEVLEYTKPIFNVELPDPKIILPREKPIPKPKPLSKWEKFRQEKGLPAKQKRSRMVYDEITKDWVPRFGHGSVKKIEEQHNWLMEDKPGQGNPFEKRKEEKKL